VAFDFHAGELTLEFEAGLSEHGFEHVERQLHLAPVLPALRAAERAPLDLVTHPSIIASVRVCRATRRKTCAFSSRSGLTSVQEIAPQANLRSRRNVAVNAHAMASRCGDFLARR